MTVEIQLTKGYVAVVDDEDADLAEAKWGATTSSHQENPTVYAARKEYPETNKTYLHRTILSRVLGRELLRTEKVDHINLDGLDDRRKNLRLATHQQNIRNSRLSRSNKSGYKGVCWYKRDQCWRAYIAVDGKQIHLGYFADAEEAREAYKNAAKEHFGEFARPE